MSAASAPPATRPTVTPKLWIGAVPPLPVIVCVNATPTVPLDNVAGNSVTAGHTGGGIGAAAITSARAIVCAQPFASVPRIVSVDAPDVVGVPASTPADVSVSPAGNAPTVTPKLYGAVPPLPVIVCVNATPTVPFGRIVGEIVTAGHTGGGIGAAAITSARAIVCAQPFASVPRIVNVDAPDVVGVPASTPADVSVSPAGNAPTVTPKLYGAVPPLPVIVCVNATPTVPLDNVAGNNVIVGHTGGTGVALQPPLVLFPDSVTGPPVAKALPVRLVPTPIVTPVCATTLPGKLTPLSVAALPTCQNTLHGSTPANETVVPTFAVNAVAMRKM